MTRPLLALADRMLSRIVPKADASGCDPQYYTCCDCSSGNCMWGTKACCSGWCSPCNVRYSGC